MNRFLHILSGLSIFVSATFGLSSCSWMKEDVTDCPTGLYVRFTYDYNTARADMFKDHVGCVKLYVYDENGNKVSERSVSNTSAAAPLHQYGYAIHFADGELPDGRYRLQAIAMQKDWDEALATPGAKYRHNDPASGSDLTVALDHEDATVTGTDIYPVSNEAPLDTLWHTLKVTSLEPQDGIAVPALAQTKKPYSVYPLEEQYVTVQQHRATYATVSMIRDTKHINITLRQVDDPANIFHEDYEVFITDRNMALAHDNEPASDVMLRYTPYQSWTSRFDEDGVEVENGLSRAESGDLQRTAHYNIMCNRLMYRSDISKCAILKIVNRRTAATVAEINLPYMLAQGRMAYDNYAYSSQEYLDREYDYHLNFFLQNGKWAYCDIVINVLGWSKRTQNEEL